MGGGGSRAAQSALFPPPKLATGPVCLVHGPDFFTECEVEGGRSMSSSSAPRAYHGGRRGLIVVNIDSRVRPPPNACLPACLPPCLSTDPNWKRWRFADLAHGSRALLQPLRSPPPCQPPGAVGRPGAASQARRRLRSRRSGVSPLAAAVARHNLDRLRVLSLSAIYKSLGKSHGGQQHVGCRCSCRAFGITRYRSGPPRSCFPGQITAAE
ncbi:hypothetical protein LX36DRAFT_269776 [Colletotrichum falcatum]|nr:hypothetical protein LX36DRAFT_269776 [Colletotrichum falcatum]